MENLNERITGRDGAASPSLIAGIIIIGIGVLFLLQNLNLFYLGDAARYWPAILIAAGMAKALDSRTSSGRMWGGLLAGAGVLLLGRELGYYRLGWGVLWPLVLIVAGALMLWTTLEGRTPNGRSNPTSELNLWALFGGGKRRLITPEFRGGEVMATFGGYEIDLRECSIAGPEAVITTNAIFGGVNIRVPRTWRVDVHVAAIFGGTEDKTTPPPADQVPAPKRLTIRGVAAFGGVVVEN